MNRKQNNNIYSSYGNSIQNKERKGAENTKKALHHHNIALRPGVKKPGIHESGTEKLYCD